MEARIALDGETFVVQLTETDGTWTANVDGTEFPLRTDRNGLRALVNVGGDLFSVDASDAQRPRIDGTPCDLHIQSLTGVAGAPDPSAGSHGPIRPPMTGKLDAVLVESGQEVEHGAVLFVLEAMKMRNEVKAPAPGRIGKISAKAGDAVDAGTTILVLEPL